MTVLSEGSKPTYPKHGDELTQHSRFPQKLQLTELDIIAVSASALVVRIGRADGYGRVFMERPWHGSLPAVAEGVVVFGTGLGQWHVCEGATEGPRGFPGWEKC